VWGLVRWRVRWNGRPVERDGACRLEDVKVLVTVDITLPEWPGARLGARDLRLRWEDFLASLRVHEYGHRDRAFLASAEVHGTLLGVRAESCLTIAQLADARALAVVRRHEELDRAYDRISLHGRTQGAVWPPSGP
jgi:predicted secreted Zn-dependent protease